MTAVLFTALRIALATVMVVAAVAKARDLAATRDAATGLGVPARLGRVVAIALPVIEGAVAIGLVINPVTIPAAIGAATLLALFTLVIARALRAGRRPACNCFGTSSSEPIGGTTLARNAVLLAAAVAIAVRGAAAGRASLGGLDRLSGAQLGGLAAVVLGAAALGTLGWFTVHLVRQQGRLLERIDRLETLLGVGDRNGHQPSGARASAPARQRHAGRHSGSPRLPIGAMAPRFALADVDGRQVTIDDLRADGRPVVLLFLETSCVACGELAAEINARGASPADRMLVGVVAGERRDVAARFAGPGFDTVLVDPGADVASRFRTNGTPTAVLVLPDGRIAAAPAEGRSAASRLVRESVERDGDGDGAGGSPAASAGVRGR